MTGLIARFRSPAELVEAVRRLRDQGYRRLDAFTPYPLPELTELLGGSTSRIGWIAALSALAGGALTYAVIYWTAVVDYPLNIGGRPLHSWQAFLPAALVSAALWSGLATLIGMLWLGGLPRWHHRLFDLKGFDRATYDRYFLLVEDDPAFEASETRRLLESLSPEHIEALGP
ncbi:DUF3341 domain-containing protein [Sphingosinicella humi]|uniref:DUF3341 domain-containing protein n=1 Tax=Allosphingosinicella humi TaxID=2068657 RepID=A0A2U2IZ73_9SPHN|nr:DUF3341 domain-containing protein [Sphingosinicella humi]PWG01367.1 DUF3341 domain-containing protein [Sphingosinicella humi]